MTTPSTFKHGYPFSKYALVPSARIKPYQRNPTTSDTKDPTSGGYYPIPTIWVNEATDAAFILTSNNGSSANWQGITDAATGNVVGPASSTDNAIARFDSTTGKIIQNSAVTMADTTGTITFPAAGGVVLTTGGAAARKGSATLVAGSVVVATTSAVTGSAISLNITALGTVTAPKTLYTTINNGVGFTITSEDATDTSTITWAIVG